MKQDSENKLANNYKNNSSNRWCKSIMLKTNTDKNGWSARVGAEEPP